VAAIPVYAYNVTPLTLDTLEIGGAVVVMSLPPMTVGGTVSPSKFLLSGSGIMTATFSDGTTWAANISMVTGSNVTLALWIGINGFFGTTGKGAVQQLSFWTALGLWVRAVGQWVSRLMGG